MKHDLIRVLPFLCPVLLIGCVAEAVDHPPPGLVFGKADEGNSGPVAEAGLAEAEDWSAVERTGTWLVARGSVLHDGAGLEGYDGGTLDFSINGTGLTVFYGAGPNRHEFSVSVDGGEPVIVDAHAPGFDYQVPALIATGLDRGDHEVRVRCLSSICAIDYFRSNQRAPRFVELEQARITLFQAQLWSDDPAIHYNMLTAQILAEPRSDYKEVFREGNCRVLAPCAAPSSTFLSAGSMTARSGDRITRYVAQRPDNTYFYRIDRGYLVAPDDELEVEFAGGETPGFRISAPGIAFLRPTVEFHPTTPLETTDGRLRFAWSGSDRDAGIHLRLHPGDSTEPKDGRPLLECDAADVGELILSETTLDAFRSVISETCDSCVGDVASGSLARYREGRATAGDLSPVLRVNTGFEGVTTTLGWE